MKMKLNTTDGQPLIRINTFNKQKYVDLQYNPDDFKLFLLDGKELFGEIDHSGQWRIKVKKAKPLCYEYFLILRESDDRKNLEKELNKLSGISIHRVGGQIFIDNKQVTENEKYLLVAGPFTSEREARHHSKDYAQLNHFRIFRQVTTETKGTLEVFDSKYDNFAEVLNGVRLVPKSNSAYFRIKNFPINYKETGKTERQDLNFQGTLEIKIDEENTLLGITELGVETYLRGVLCSELADHVHAEFVKSMAIVSRSQIFSRIGQVHALEGFDFCSDSHCLRYYGKCADLPEIDMAINETSGMVLSSNGQVCDAYFSYSCGGHTEDASGVWLDKQADYLKGKIDSVSSNNRKLDLRQEKNVQEWILSRPDVLCKPDVLDVDNYEQVSTDAFRWEIFYTRKELEDIIYEKTGEELGIIYEIIPLVRGASGRIKELEILSSLKNIRIKGELNIRSAFSNSLLNSSCFIVKPEVDGDGVPLNFTLIGAGKGHGVGLCKTGAAKMSLNGIDYKQILAHYFDKCKIKRIY